MKTSDPIANLLSSFANATRVQKTQVAIPASTLKLHILTVLKEEGIIKEVTTINEGQGDLLSVTLDTKYTKFKRLSKPGRRVYARASQIPRKYRETIIVSTPKGIMTAKKAIKNNLGGEILLEVS